MPLPRSIFRLNSIFLKRWEQVTFYPRNTTQVTDTNGVSTSGFALYRAKRGDDDKNLDSPPLAKQGMPWTLWRDDLEAVGAPDPAAGDVIQDGRGIRWTVETVKRVLDDNGFELTTTQEITNSSP